VLGLPEGSSTPSNLQQALKREIPFKTAVRLKEYSPKASRSIPRVSVADLLSSTQKLMQTRCLILPFIEDKIKYEVQKALV
jgi:hypothetical protein